MSFLEFTICMYCVLSCADIARFVTANRLSLYAHVPINKNMRTAFFVLTTPAMLAVLALPFYGFVVLRWWQPIVGILIASVLANGVTRNLLLGSHWLYLWAIGFSLAGSALFFYFQFT